MIRICENIMAGMADAFRRQDEHYRDHHEPDPHCWYCTHNDDTMAMYDENADA